MIWIPLDFVRWLRYVWVLMTWGIVEDPTIVGFFAWRQSDLNPRVIAKRYGARW